jgi:hypothetical protein
MFTEYPELVRILIVMAFPAVAFAACLLALFAGGHEHTREDIQQGDGDWMWPSR